VTYNNGDTSVSSQMFITQVGATVLHERTFVILTYYTATVSLAMTSKPQEASYAQLYLERWHLM